MELAQCLFHLQYVNCYISLFRLFTGSFHRYFPPEFSRKYSLFLTSEAIENNYRNNLYGNIKDLYIPIKGKYTLVHKQQAHGDKFASVLNELS